MQLYMHTVWRKANAAAAKTADGNDDARKRTKALLETMHSHRAVAHGHDAIHAW